VKKIFLRYNLIMTTYKIIYDVVQDAYNWFNSINTFSSGDRLEGDDREIAKKIKGLTFVEAKKVLVPFLEKRNQTINMPPERFQKIMSAQLEKYFELAVKKLEQVTKYPLAVQDCAKNRAVEIAKIDARVVCPQTDLLLLITTFPAMVVYCEEGIIYTYAKVDQELWGAPLDGILHELMHFQTDHYYRQNPNSPVSKLSEDDYYVLKESTTALLDETWKPLVTLPDCSYPEYQDLRNKLNTFYHRRQDFDQLMNYGAREVVKNSHKGTI